MTLKRFLRLAIVSFIIFFALITAIGLFFPPQVTVMRRATIPQPKEKLYPLIADMRNWHTWLADSTVTFAPATAATTGKGAALVIGGKRVAITTATPDYIEALWEMREGRNQTSGFYLQSDSLSGGTIVQLHFTQKLKWYPWERIASRLNEKILGPVLDANLARLEAVSKQQ